MIVKKQDKESTDSLIERFKKQCRFEAIMDDWQRKRYFRTKSELRKMKMKQNHRLKKILLNN